MTTRMKVLLGILAVVVGVGGYMTFFTGGSDDDNTVQVSDQDRKSAQNAKVVTIPNAFVTIRGTIRRGGKPASGVTVELHAKTANGALQAASATHEQGLYSFQGLQPGMYVVVVKGAAPVTVKAPKAGTFTKNITIG